ncbi:Zinc finger RING/FYVE/PHD-type protein [Dioscorea alata]|uniref:Zinc finger RING/FYVE/PHD-type protein n=1 Tax=Dioscorea alata TaxID=55571 RepID=A0ACB7VZG9_DIOAL|nr:Zinc finger RING/FYVE/PHD-type protein [Dioscorea alata]
MPIPVPPKSDNMPSMSISSSSESVDGAALKISGEVMVGAVIFLFMVLVFVILLYLYARRYWGATLGLNGSSHSRRLIFVPDTAPRRRGLDESVLHSLPVATFCSSDFKDGLECAVCLSDISDGEKFRLLPKCNHGFHLECIDMWFFSHSTCPLCRSAVAPEPIIRVPGNPVPAAPSTEIEAEAEAEVPTPEFPTNVLFWGTPNQVSATVPPIQGSSSAPQRPEGMLVIDIPKRAMEGFSSSVPPFTSSRATVEEAKSPVEASDMKSPASARFKSLIRLLSYGKRSAAGPSSSWSSPREGGDVELGQGVLATATTPRTPPMRS